MNRNYCLSTKNMPTRNASIMIIGCGGTGGFVAEGLCRLPSAAGYEIVLVDFDRVEPHNLRRQSFYEGDIGKFKSQALAERLSRLYGRQVIYSVYPFSKELELILDSDFGNGFYTRLDTGIIIGCVDNAAGRKAIAGNIQPFGWWLDAGNGEHSGQVLIGNTDDNRHLESSFLNDGTVTRLPLPTTQQPSLLVPAPQPEKRLDCAEAVEAGDQSPVINQAMAVLVLEFMDRLLTGRLTWMGAYLDLEAGTLSTVPAMPKEVARLTGLRVNQLVEKDKG